MSAPDRPAEQLRADGSNNEDNLSSPPVGEDHQAATSGQRIEIADLRDLANRFIAQAQTLRVKAVNNIRLIVATVCLMTILVVILPPIIDIVEDEILMLFGRETSKFDFQAETRRQAIEVQASSTILLRMLEERDAAVKNIRDELMKPYHFFKPDALEGREIIGDLFIEDVAQAGSLQVAVGGVRDIDDITPAAFFRTSSEGVWEPVKNVDPLLKGFLTRAMPFKNGVLITGTLPKVDGAPPTNAVRFVSAEGEMERIMPSLSFSDQAPPISQVAISEGSLAFLLGPDDANYSLVVVTDEAGNEIFSQSYGMGEVAKDVIWSDKDLLILTDGGLSGGDVVYRYPAISADPVLAKEKVHQFLLERSGTVRFVRDKNALGSVSILSFIVGFFEIFRQESINEWVVQRNQSFDIDNIDVEVGHNSLLMYRRMVFLGGEVNKIWVKSNTSDAAYSITLSSQLGLDSPLEFDVLNDGKIRLLSLSLRSRDSSDAWSLYSEADAPELPVVQTLQDIVILLEGKAAVGASTDMVGSGDKTAASERVSGGSTYLSDSLADFKEALRPEWIVSTNTITHLTNLEKMEERWAREWSKRERAATILARLRQADETGSLFNEVSSLGARLAVIALLVYLVNILVNLYRYNMRLAAFYQAQGNSIELAIASGADIPSMIGTSFHELASAQTPELVSFGTRPAPPTETVAKAVADLAKVIKP